MEEIEWEELLKWEAGWMRRRQGRTQGGAVGNQ